MKYFCLSYRENGSRKLHQDYSVFFFFTFLLCNNYLCLQRARGKEIWSRQNPRAQPPRSPAWFLRTSNVVHFRLFLRWEELVSKSLIITFLFPHVFHSDKNILSLCVDCCYNSPAGVCIVWSTTHFLIISLSHLSSWESLLFSGSSLNNVWCSHYWSTTPSYFNTGFSWIF